MRKQSTSIIGRIMSALTKNSTLRLGALCLLCGAAILSVGRAGAATTNWIAFNEHAAGTGTSNHVTVYSVPNSTTAVSGRLTNVLAPAGFLSAAVTIQSIGAAPNNVGGDSLAPTNGPALVLFGGRIDWLKSALIFPAASPWTNGYILYTFTNLDPNRRYSFRGTAVRGTSTRRWTVVGISNILSAVPAHEMGPDSSGIVTNGWAGLGDRLAPGTQAAVRFGENRMGDMAGWDEIVPNGTSFSIICENYLGYVGVGAALPGGTIDNNYCYALSAFFLAEVGGPLSAVLGAPTNNAYTSELRPVTASVTVAGGEGPYTVTFYTNINGGEFSAAAGTGSFPYYTRALGQLPAATYQVYAEVSDAESTVVRTATNTFTVSAPIPVPLTGVIENFSTKPPVGRWATFSAPGGTGDVADEAGLDAMMAGISANNFTFELLAQTDATAQMLGIYRSDLTKALMRPTGNKATLVMATLANQTGATVGQLNGSYLLGALVVDSEQIRGVRIYYSLNGTSWTPVATHTQTTVGESQKNFSLTGLNWAPGAPLYLVWADDNGDGTEGQFTLDDVAFSPLLSAPVVRLDSPAHDAVVPPNYPVQATATVFSSVAPPHTVNFYTNNGAGGPFALAASVSGVTAGTVNAELGIFDRDAGSFEVYVEVVDSADPPNVGYSATNQVQVLVTPLVTSVTFPAAATYNYGTEFTVTVSISGGEPPHTTQLYLDSGSGFAPVAPALGVLPVGEYAIYAAIADNGTMTTNTATNQFSVVANPLSVALASPVEGSVWRPDQRIPLAATVGLNPPMTSQVAFYANGQLLHTDATAPFTHDPILPEGVYELAAVAEDNLGRRATSAPPVTVEVMPAFVSWTGIPLTETFDGLGTNGTILLRGWYAGWINPANNIFISTNLLGLSDGSILDGFAGWNMGTVGDPDRSLGVFATGEQVPSGYPSSRFVEVQIKNETTEVIRQINITYDGEQWRTAENTLDFQLESQISVNRTNYTPVDLVFIPPWRNATSPRYALDGKDPTNRVAGLTTGNFTLPQPVPPGGMLWVRWYDFNDSGADPMLAIDNFSFSAVSALNNAPTMADLSVGVTEELTLELEVATLLLGAADLDNDPIWFVPGTFLSTNDCTVIVTSSNILYYATNGIGADQFTLILTDGLGGDTPVNVAVRVYGVNEALICTVTSPAPGNYPFGTEFTAAASVSGGVAPYTVALYLDRGTGFELVEDAQLGVLPAGDYAIYATAADSGTLSAVSATNEFTVTANPLSVALTSPVEGATIRHDRPVNFAATVGLLAPLTSQVEFYVDGQLIHTDSEAPFAHAAPLAVGPHELWAVAEDSLSRRATSAPPVQIMVAAPQLSWTGPSLTEDFDGLGIAGTVLLPGWYAGWMNPDATTVIYTNVVAVSDGSSIGGHAAFNVGTFNDPDRALALFATGTGVPSGYPSSRFLEVQIKNDTTNYIRQISVTYDGEQWRTGDATRAFVLTNLFSLDGVSYAGLNRAFVPPWTATSSAAALNGNDPSNRVAGVTTGLFALPAPVAPGGVLYLRWYDYNDDGADPLLAVDNFAFTAVAAPNQAPSLPDFAGVVRFGSNLVFNVATVLAGASDPEQDPVSLVTGTFFSTKGCAVVVTASTITYSATNSVGDDQFELTLIDAYGATAPVTVSVLVREVNYPPELAAINDQDIPEGTQLSLTASATDPDLPEDTLSFHLVDPPAGAAIDPATGAFTWTPSEAQGPNSFLITVVVTDAREPSLSATQSFTVVVREVNVAPVLALIPDQVVDEGTLLVLTNTATDADLPANALTFELVGAPEGAAIDPATGVFTWTPTEAQGPDTNIITVVVRDDGEPSLSATQSFTVVVREVNVAPVLALIPDQVVDEGTLLVLTNTATDADLPANALAFALVDPPAGAAIDPATGVFTWTPAEAQGPDTNIITVVVRDDGEPSLSATQSFTVVVREVNVAPVLGETTNRMIAVGQMLSFTVEATDADLPANTLAFALVDPPAGAAIDPATGAFTWTPTNSHVGTNEFVIVVTDDGEPVLSTTNTFVVVVVAAPSFNLDEGGARVENGQMVLTWQTIPGKRYQILYADDLNQAEWSAMEPVTATGATLSVSDPVDRPHRYYRIVQLD